MSQATLASTKTGGMVVLTILLFFLFAGGPAKADPCADVCRGQHNACRMAAKLLFSGRCDAILQGCIMQCFANARMNRDRAMREGRDVREFRDRRGPPVVGGPPDFRGPAVRGPDRGPDRAPDSGPEARGPDPKGPPDLREPELRAPPRDFRGFRDREPRGGPYLGGPGGWRGPY